jgi:hypothetical protein
MILVGAVGAVPSINTQVPVETRAVPAVFQPFYQGPVLSEERARQMREALPYESIALERSGGMLVPGGLFRLVLHRNGTATLWTDGSNRFARAGEYVGTIKLDDFAKVSHLIAEAEFERLAPRYAVQWSDQTEDTVTVVAGARRVAVVDYGGAGPVRLWAIQRAIEAVALNIRWNAK